MFKRKKHGRESKEMALNITSLMDIMTIILIFLLVSFSSQESEVTPPPDIDLPMSTSERPVRLAVKISVSSNEIRVEDKSVVKLVNGAFARRDVNKDKQIIPLLRELQRQKGRLEAGTHIDTGRPEDENEAEIVYFEAEKGTRYDLIDTVLKTAAGAGFTRFRLAVNKNV